MDQILPSLNVFKTRVNLGTYDQLLDIISERIEIQKTLCIDTSNTVVLSLAATDNKFREALKSYDLLLPDARPLVWYLKLLGGNIRETCYGPETALRVWRRFSCSNKVLIIGSNEKTEKAFESKFSKPARWITEKINPESRENMTWLQWEIETIDPEIIFLALGCPKSYFVLQQIKHSIKRAVVIHVGGSFDLISGRKKLTPIRLQRMGLGWLYRLTQEPRRLWKRYLKFNSLFILCVCRYYISDRKKARQQLGIQSIRKNDLS